MTKKKSTKRALISSLLILAMCFTMLAGTTFAWFTDSVTSSGNRILAGKLDIDLVMDKTANGNYVSIADGQGDIFKEAANANDSTATLWEPNKTQFAFLGVKNNGNLYASYRIIIDVTDNGLADALEFAYIDGAKAADVANYTNWAAVQGAAGQNVGQLAAGRITAATQGSLAPDAADYFALAIHMKDDAGNTYQEKDVYIDIAVVATQDNVEEDAFGPDYDKDAEFPQVAAPVYITSAADFTAALSGTDDTVEVGSNITVSGPQTISGKTLDGNGNTITVTNTGSSCGIHAKSGTIENLTVEGSGRGIGSGSGADQKMDGDLTINNVTVNGPVYGMNIGDGDGHKVIVTNSTINGWNSMANVDATFTNCTFGKAAGYATFAVHSNSLTFNNCSFSDRYEMFGRPPGSSDGLSSGTVTINNCTVGGVQVTAANFKQLFNSSGDTDFSVFETGQVIVTIDGVEFPHA